jgi:LPXTG-motif cell wall-anchored protein
MYPRVGVSALSSWERLLLAIGVGLLLGAGTHWLLPRTGDVRHNSLILLGMAALGAGSAALLKLSGLFVSIIAGMVFANLSPRKEDVYGLMAAREHTLYAVFLLIGGSMFRFESVRVLWVLVPLYVLARGVGKVLGGALGRQLFLRESRFSRRVGAGLLFQGGMPLVFAVQFEHALGLSPDFLVMTTFVMAVLVNDLIATPLAVLALRREGWE